MFGKGNLDRNIVMLCGLIEPRRDTRYQRDCIIKPLTKPEHSIMLNNALNIKKCSVLRLRKNACHL